MNNLRKTAAGLLVTLLVVTLWSATGSSQDERRQPSDGSSTRAAENKQQAPSKNEMSAEEKLVRDVYARLMRYQSAAVDETAARGGTSGAPADYLTFELRDIRSGNVVEILDRALSEMVSARSESMISLRQVHLSEKNNSPHAYYEAHWTSGAGAKPSSRTAAGAGETAAAQVRDIPGIAAFDRYSAFEVRVNLQGKQVRYRAMALYQLHSSDEAGEKGVAQESARPARVEILDNVTVDVNSVYADESPRVRSPWQKYVKSSLYQAVVRTIKETKESGAPLFPANAPIGYLPGDDVSPNDKDTQSIAASSSCIVTVSLTATGVAESGKPTHFISLRNTGNVTITATLDPPGSDPATITWTGGTAGADNLHRIVSTTTVADTNVTATVGTQSATVRIHVIDATAPPAAASAPKTFTNGGTANPGTNFGITVVTIGQQSVVAPTYHVDPHFTGDHWVFVLRDVAHSYRLGTNSQGRINLPNGNPATFPLAPGMNLVQSHTEARDDFNTSGLTNTGPRRRSYWVDFITQNHEQAHVNNFYSATYWLAHMGLFESTDVEGASITVVYDCNDATTTTGAAAVTRRTPTWNTDIATRHTNADNAEQPGSEGVAHGVSNPQYAPIRNAIPNP